MSSICCRYVITRNSFLHCRRQDFIVTSFFVPYLSSKQIRFNSNSVIPVKLAYVSYESMGGNKNASKQPIIIMHGLFGSKTNWNSLSKTIHRDTNRKVITIDARNHGDSPHSSDMTYSHMAQDIVQLMNDLGFEKSILVGHSMGGSAMIPQLMNMEKIFKAMRTVNLEGVTTLTKARTSVKDQLANAIKSLPLRQFLAMNLVEANNGKFKWRVNLPVLEQNFAQIAVFPDVGSRVYNGSTLFMGGSKSDYIKVEDHDKIKKLFPSASFIYINDADHWVHADKPTEFLKTTIDFINQP
ncbi:protein ABHD11-like isoform X2 [Frieseomelitta varia]|uniref:protein ABHD11-like isoform X2 n=1 Tax=Frieseomelitta varia TaxID=561572 RepID=UPI001CB6819E|nr:protein ABHD11-like isoform X2 [Frieseomelitta varia]